MSTTTIRLPKNLKTRVAAAAGHAGASAHGFILEVIAEKTDREAQNTDFLDTAEKRYANVIASGTTIAWEKMRVYLEARLAGNKAARPAGRIASVSCYHAA